MGLSDLITQLPELIGQAVEANQWLGYTAIFAAMFLENLFPPSPSELIMPLGGFFDQQSQLDLFLAEGGMELLNSLARSRSAAVQVECTLVSLLPLVTYH